MFEPVAMLGGVVAWWLTVGQAQPAATAVAKPTPPAATNQVNLTAEMGRLRRENSGLKAELAAVRVQLDAERKRKSAMDTAAIGKLLRQLAADGRKTQQGLSRLSAALKTATDNERDARADIGRVRRDLKDAKRRLDVQAGSTRRLKEEVTDLKYRFSLLQKRNLQLAGQVKQQAENLQEIETRGSAVAPHAADASPKGKPAPAEMLKVSGLVRQVDYKNKLVLISIGSDDGVREGQELAVYRTGARPSYLGTVEVVAVKPDQAVGRIALQVRPEAFRAGDKVGPKAPK